MNYENFKRTVYSLIEEYEETEANLTEDEDISNRMPFLTNTALQWVTGIKKIIKKHNLDRSAAGDTEYYREYDMETLISDLYQVRSVYALDETTNAKLRNFTFELDGNVITINDQQDGNVKVEYNAYPLFVTDETEDDADLLVPRDSAILAAFKVADLILVTDVSANYAAFRQEFESRLRSFDARTNDNVISYGTKITLEN